MAGQVSGRFDVSLAPQTQADDVPNGRMTLRKTFHGELAGTSVGEMLTSSDAKDGSGAYVALERFSGQLGGRSGSFYLVHRGIMDRGRADLSIIVVPGSGTGALEGLTGTLRLDLASKDHAFIFDYSLASEAGRKESRKMARLNYVELPVREIGPAKAFYEAAFGWSLTGFGPTYAATLTGDTDIGLQADAAEATAAPLPVIDVQDLEAALASVQAAGGEVVRPIFAFPGGRRFHFRDPSGNEVAAVQPGPQP